MPAGVVRVKGVLAFDEDRLTRFDRPSLHAMHIYVFLCFLRSVVLNVTDSGRGSTVLSPVGCSSADLLRYCTG